MVLRRGKCTEFLPRPLLVSALVGFLIVFAVVSPVEATLLPPGFFDMSVQPGSGAAAVEADRLSYNAQTGTISADGAVVLSFQGYVIHADSIKYDQKTGGLHAVGNIMMMDPSGTRLEMDSIEITGGMKEAFLNSLTLTTAEGAVITAKDVHYADTLTTILTDAAYSPCGLCIDSKGRRIGWKVKAARMTYDRKSASVTLEQPSLELLGVPVAWLPWFWIPDPTQPRATGLRMPSVDFTARRGAILTVPYFVPSGEDIDILLKPQLMSRQGFLMSADVKWRLPGLGQIDVSAGGLYQLDKSAYAGTVGYRDWRGAIQTSGTFTPTKEWTVGWSYSVFSDNAFLSDYGDATKGDNSINQVYATHLSTDTFIDARLQHFNRIGDYASDDPAQGDVLPNVKFAHVQDLAPGWGRVNVNGELLGVHRGADQLDDVNGVKYVNGYEGNKAHLKLEGAWEDRYILPTGIVATPYLGARLDGAWYDRTTGAVAAGYPAASDAMLFNITPIAAMDFRWPLLASNGLDTHLLEPVAQLVYRGSSTTAVGITNDDAQSFIFDTSNLFSYNRFSGIDRQETGLRANVGVHYAGNFADGSWIDAIAGQSFHLLGVNALGVPDAAQIGTSTGLGNTASYIVASVRGGFSNGVNLGGKLQVDPTGPRITRAAAGISFTAFGLVSVGSDYSYVVADPLLGTVTDKHTVSGSVGVPVADYWTATAGLSYDISGASWSAASTGLTYDDGYLVLGASANATPTSWGFGVHFGLKGPDGEIAF